MHSRRQCDEYISVHLLIKTNRIVRMEDLERDMQIDVHILCIIWNCFSTYERCIITIVRFWNCFLFMDTNIYRKGINMAYFHCIKPIRSTFKNNMSMLEMMYKETSNVIFTMISYRKSVISKKMMTKHFFSFRLSWNHFCTVACARNEYKRRDIGIY